MAATAMVEHLAEDVEEKLEGLCTSRRHHHAHTSSTVGSVVAVDATTKGGQMETKPAKINGSLNEEEDKEKVEKSVYFDSNADKFPVEQNVNVNLLNVDFHQIFDAVTNNQKEEFQEAESSISREDEHTPLKQSSGKGKELAKDDPEEESEEEVLELEVERAVQKLHTHTMHCPKCNSEITKVILRRKRTRPPAAATSQPREPVDLFGCLSCFSFFILEGNCWIFGNRGKKENPQNLQQPLAAAANLSSSGAVKEQDHKKHDVAATNAPHRSDAPSTHENFSLFGQNNKSNEIVGSLTTEPQKPEKDEPYAPEKPIRRDDVRIDIEAPLGSKVPAHDVQIPITSGASLSTPNVIDVPRPIISSEAPASSKSFEILKSIVYGGLIESITSLGIVSSAAASDATTLNIVTLGVANLIGGLLIIWHNLWDLKAEAASGKDRYQELLGSRDNFIFHATAAVLSFIIFGLVSPAIYGFSFYESDDKDLKLLSVAAASLLCIFILSIGKAYIQRAANFLGYFKTVLYYTTTAIVASGVSYALGDLAKKLLLKCHLFESSPAAADVFLPMTNSANPAWATY